MGHSGYDWVTQRLFAGDTKWRYYSFTSTPRGGARWPDFNQKFVTRSYPPPAGGKFTWKSSDYPIDGGFLPVVEQTKQSEVTAIKDTIISLPFSWWAVKGDKDGGFLDVFHTGMMIEVDSTGHPV